jgi:hypothetical protein
VIRWKVAREEVDPQVADDIDALLKQDPAFWVVTFGFRTRETQATLYRAFLLWLEQHPDASPKDGPRAAPPGSSAHEGNGTPGTAMAVDLTLVRNGKDIWTYTDPDWRRLVALVKAHPRLHSLDGIGDTDHVEAVNWKAKLAARAAHV